MLMTSETQIHGKRRAPRYYLGGVVELTDLDSGRMKVALVRAVSLYGCLVKTEMPVKEAASVLSRLHIPELIFPRWAALRIVLETEPTAVSELSSLRLTPSIKIRLKA